MLCKMFEKSLRRIIAQILNILDQNLIFCGRDQLPIWKNNMTLVINRNLVLIMEHQVTVTQLLTVS